MDRGDAAFFQPVPDVIGDELPAVVGADVARSAVLVEQLAQEPSDLAGADVPADVAAQRFTGALVDDVEDAQLPAVDGVVRNEVVAPDVVRIERRQVPGSAS